MTLTHISGSKQWSDFGGQPNILLKCPILFVIPPAPLDQVTLKCNHFLDHSSFDVIKYLLCIPKNIELCISKPLNYNYKGGADYLNWLIRCVYRYLLIVLLINNLFYESVAPSPFNLRK